MQFDLADRQSVADIFSAWVGSGVSADAPQPSCAVKEFLYMNLWIFDLNIAD